MKTLLLLPLALIALAGAAPAAEPTPPPADLATTLKEHCLTLKWEDGQPHGPAMDLFVKEAQASQFFMIGEWHGGVEPPQLASALFRAFQPFGYRHIVAESGPVTTEYLEKQAAGPDGVKAIGALAVKYPFTLPFFGWREEAQYLAAAVQAAGKDKKVKRVVWGVDQEFIFSPGLLLPLVGPLPRTADPAALSVWATARENGNPFMGKKSMTTPPWLATAAPADFDLLAKACPKQGEAARAVSELRDSAEIYQAWSQPGEGYHANQLRADLMRRHFNAYYDEALAAGEETPRALCKLGDNHMVRGRSFTDVFDLGTLLPDLAARKGLRTFQMLLVARGGHINGVRPDSPDPKDQQAPYSAADTEEGFDAAPLFAAAPAGEWALLDFRPLRPLLSAGKLKADAVMTRMIWGFDAVLVVPESHAAADFE